MARQHKSVTPEKARIVQARFGGQEIEFGLSSHALFAFTIKQKSPYATLERLLVGTWSMDDLETVLRAAYKRTGSIAKNQADTVLLREPPGNYVPLAIKIMQAFLFGLDPDKAVFDERDPFKNDEPADVA